MAKGTPLLKSTVALQIDRKFVRCEILNNYVLLNGNRCHRKNYELIGFLVIILSNVSLIYQKLRKGYFVAVTIQ